MMVKDDSLYVIAIVAVVAVVGLVVMATGGSSTVVAEDSIADSDAAIAGQATFIKNDAPGITIAASGVLDTEYKKDAAGNFDSKALAAMSLNDAEILTTYLNSVRVEDIQRLSSEELYALIEALQLNSNKCAMDAEECGYYPTRFPVVDQEISIDETNEGDNIMQSVEPVLENYEAR